METTTVAEPNATPQAPGPTTTCPFHTLPAELLLDLISSVPFTPTNFLSLRLTCRRFHDILTQHEATIVKSGARKNYGQRTVALFPALETSLSRKGELRDLSRLHSRIVTLDQVHVHWLKITSHSPELEWLKGRFEGIHKAGLLLLYHLQDLSLQPAASDPPAVCINCQRISFLRSLPATSLACLLFKLISSVKILRIYGPEPINESWRKGDAAARSEVEIVTEELILRCGPWFFLALLAPEANPKLAGQALGRLAAELESLHLRQHPHPFQPPTLISVVRRALAEKCDVEVRSVVSKMWEILASTGFDALIGPEGEITEIMVKLVKGEELSGGERGLRRIF